MRAVAALIALNLASFIAITSLPAFQRAHHHWIFPALALLFAGEWAGTFALGGVGKGLDPAAARSAVASSMVFLLAMGILRHATILACFDRCAFKLAAAAAVSAPIFWAQGRVRDGGWWSPRRSSLAAIASAAWAAYLSLRGLGLSSWLIDGCFAMLALIFWLGRSRADFLLVSLGIGAAIAIREAGSENLRIALGVVWSVAIPLACVDRLELWLRGRARAKPAPPISASRKILRGAVTAIATAVAGVYIIGPVFLTTDREQRRQRLAMLAPRFPIQDPKTLSPLAARLRGHVLALASEIGERDAFQPGMQARAREYIRAQLVASGYSPKERGYQSQWMPAVKNGARFANIEAILAASPAGERGAWIVGAHYDSAPGTPGADDNASAVAVLLESARLIKGKKPPRDVRFVAFGTEEPPAFGSGNMGSVHYARYAQENGVRVHGMISLEMLGYYNPRRGAQLYPPFLHLFYPSHGDYVSAVGNVKSRRLVAQFAGAWRAGSDFPLRTAVLPGVLSSLALSDQLSFWDRGYPALMLSDTAFYRNPNYHEAADLPETLDYEKIARVTLALVESLSSRAYDDVPPEPRP